MDASAISQNTHIFADPPKEVLSGKGKIEYLIIWRATKTTTPLVAFFPARFQDDSRVVFSLLFCYNLYRVQDGKEA
jgi:hypothetical protein